MTPDATLDKNFIRCRLYRRTSLPKITELISGTESLFSVWLWLPQGNSYDLHPKIYQWEIPLTNDFNFCIWSQ